MNCFMSDSSKNYSLDNAAFLNKFAKEAEKQGIGRQATDATLDEKDLYSRWITWTRYIAG